MEFMKVLTGRRAVNFFDPAKPVSDELLKRIIEAASLAPSSFNLQPRQIIIVKSPADKERLKAVAWGQPKITEAPVVLIVLADKDGWKSGSSTVEKVWQNMVELGYLKPEQREWFDGGKKSLYDGPEKALSFGVKNAAFFGMALMLAAKDAGLDSHPMDGFDHEGVRKAFNIPDNFFVPMLIALGYFNDKLKLMPPKWRKSYSELVFKVY
ncbi:MAG TPA: nitroreductase family protein [Syntrophales bacterium]|nr:nitroreductase family protein [Syntrophales bacterium]